VGRRILPALLAAVAVVADARGAHGLARNALLLAVPFAAVAGLTSFGRYLDARGDLRTALQAGLWAVSVVLLVLSCAIRSQALHVIPPLAISSVVGALGVYATIAALAAAPHARRLGLLRPAKP
jgi:hypothetical protein